MGGIRTPAVRNEIRLGGAIGNIKNVKSWRARRQGEVRNADIISLIDTVAVSRQSVEGAA
jgi:hypothetical protein